MIVTLTAHPSVDRTIEVAQLRRASAVRPRPKRVVAVDTSGKPLGEAIGGSPHLVKPNRDELAELTGRRIATISDVVAAATTLRRRGVGAVLTSLGPDGAVLVTGDGAWHATAPHVEPRSTVGAGDAALPGYLPAGLQGPPPPVEAVAWGSAATALAGTR